MSKKEKPIRKGPTKYRTPKSFLRNRQRRNPALDQRRQIPVIQHRA